MAEDRLFTKAGLMRMNRTALLNLASAIEFIGEANTKSEIADAILIMRITTPRLSPPVQRPDVAVPSNASDPDGSNPEMSVRVRRIREASSNTKGAASRDSGPAETELKRGL